MKVAVPTLLKALRQASTADAISNAMEQIFDRLISTSSLKESQNLVFSLQQYRLYDGMYQKLQQTAAICTEPSSKAAYLGFVLLQESVHMLKTIDMSTQRDMLLKVWNANKNVLSGYIAALTAGDGPFYNVVVDINKATTTMELISPVFKSVLMDNCQSEGHKVAVLDTLSRIAWHFDGHLEDKNHRMRTLVIHLLVQALELVPYAQLLQQTYVVHVALIVDLLTFEALYTKEDVALATRTVRFVLESTQLLIQKDVGVIALLQLMEQLARTMPEAFTCSVFMTSAAYFLVNMCETPLEQQMMLCLLQHILVYERNVVADHGGRRRIYVEILLLPLSAMLSVHGSIVSDLLKLVVEITSLNTYAYEVEVESSAPPTETSTHARSAIQMVGDEESCQRWLSSLFMSKGAISGNNTDKWLALLVVALLFDGRPALRSAAAECLSRQVSNSPKFWNADVTKALVASLVFLISQQPSRNTKAALGQRHFGEWMISCLYSLAALAATTTETMRIVLRLIDSMNGMTKTRPMALKLMYEVWFNEPRVFPRLETMLLEPTSSDEDIMRHVVRMASIKTLCEKDPELGVQFISSIQGFLEDELESVVSMAMDAITALCRGDCLDFYVAFKIIAQKMRKNKVTCAEGSLFQERLCCFYALGGIDSVANEKHASKLLNQAWEFADSEHANVRKSAYEALCKFPLDMLGLCVPVNEIATHPSDDENGAAVEEVEEQLDDVMERLQNEQDLNVRIAIEELVAKIIEHESTKLTVGIGRGQRMKSAASGVQRQPQRTFQQSGPVTVVSAAATKEMKALFPSRAEVESLFPTDSSTTDWSGFLLAYQPKALIDRKNVKRKDKLVRFATQNVDELVMMVSTVLQSMELPWASVGVSGHGNENCKVFVLIQALMEGWIGFMETYISLLDELAELKTPIGVDDADVAFRVFSEGVTSLFDLLLNHTSNKVGGALAAGALAGKLCESRHWSNSHLRLKYEEVVEKLSLQLALSIEHARVFSTYDCDARVSSIGALIALQLSFGRRKSETCSSFCIQLAKIENMFMELYHNESDGLLATCALLGLSHIAFLYTNGYELETFEVTQWRHQRVKPIAERLMESFLRTNHAKQSNKSSLFHEDVVFPLSEVTETNNLIDTVSSKFKQSLSSGSILLRWASLMGLARLSSGFSSIKRLDWLTNVRKVLTAVWENCGSANITAVALGPVLLHCVLHNLSPSLSLETFVTTCNQRAAKADADSLDSGFLMMAAANVLCRLDSFGGFPSTVRNETNLTVKQIKKTLENESVPDQAVHELMLLGIVNFFHLSGGIAGPSFVGATSDMGANVMLTLDCDTIVALVKLARDFTQSERHCATASAMLGAISRAADRFYVSQKKKLFDAEVRALPSDKLLVKTLEWLRQTNPFDDDNSSYEISMTRLTPKARTAISLLGCLTSAGAVLPLLDYASLIHRVMLRLCSVDASVACIRFAATQGSCDELLAGKVLSSEWFGNANAVLQSELMAWLALAAARFPTDVLETLLITIFDVLKNIWRRDASSSRSTLLFDSWTVMLRDILHAKTTRRIPESSLEMVNKVILEKMVMELPFDVHVSIFVKQFAVRVLSKLDYSEHSPVETYLNPNVAHSSVWSWWRSGMFVIELAKLEVFVVTKRETSLLFQWILRHDFKEWTDDNLVDMYLHPFIAQVGALVAQHTTVDENVSLLLDLVDTFSQAMASLESSAHSDAMKCRALFAVMACILAWNSTLSHEKYLLQTSRSKSADVATAICDVLPFGLIACTHGSKRVSTLSERLLVLLHELTRLNEDIAGRYTRILQVCSRQMYLTADSWHISSTTVRKVRELWSLCETD
ncbi:unnamed protein product [Peronospora belbahrii]|uniref:DUF3730 domain-containing protein n=1 Tax=Peronospora belbahrii TaxID=622444 RepID=A0AAU9KMH7_9STRA|nr:unnamed protein product [Peronospora belbahrii]